MGRIPLAQEERSESTRSVQIKYLWPFHKELARRIALGQKPKEIAARMGLNPQRLSVICNTPLFQEEVKKLMEGRDAGVTDVVQTFKEISPVAADTIERMMYETKNEKVRLQCATEILDRAGYGKVNKVEVGGSIGHNHFHRMSTPELKRLVMERLTKVAVEDVALAERERLLNAPETQDPALEAFLEEPVSDACFDPKHPAEEAKPVTEATIGAEFFGLD